MTELPNPDVRTRIHQLILHEIVIQLAPLIARMAKIGMTPEQITLEIKSLLPAINSCFIKGSTMLIERIQEAGFSEAKLSSYLEANPPEPLDFVIVDESGNLVGSGYYPDQECGDGGEKSK